MQEAYRKLSLFAHPASLLVAAAFDLLWGLPEGLLTASWVGLIFLPFLMLAAFLISASAVVGIQVLIAGDSFSTALGKGLLLGALAAVPYPFIGVAVSLFWGIMRLTYGVDPEVILLGKLTRSWRSIEGTLRDLAPEMRGQSLETVIECLRSQHRLSSSLAEQLQNLRRQRNINVHDISTEALAALVDQVQAMEQALNRRFLR